MKNGLARPAIDRIVKAMLKVCPEFNSKRFIQTAMQGIDSLELKERVTHLIQALARALPDSFPDAARILSRVPPIWDPGDAEDPIAGFAAWPITDYVATHGLNHPKTALRTLKKLTSMFSAEFAIRPFLLKHPDLTYDTLEIWSTDRDEHVRRLVSEGTRPRLPWGIQLKPAVADPARGLSLLEKLKDDPSLYVRRSVANHLNDIAKDHANTCISTCRRWSKGASADRRWIIRHATRTLVKAGHPQVFPLLGFTPNPSIKIDGLKLNQDSIRLGEAIELTATLKSTAKRKQRLVIDYAIHHQKANGDMKPKVFKLRELDLAPGESVAIAKSHRIKPITTRKYHPGAHAVELLVNGQPTTKSPFTLRM
jgi:3-methyladenine DNA glycosylase AlkC